MAVMQPDEASMEPPGWETIEELFAALESPLLSYAFGRVGELSVAEDMVQEAFMKLHAQFEKVREPRRWLYRTVHNQALNLRRQPNKTVPLDTQENTQTATRATDPQPLPDEHIARGEGIG